MSETKPVYNKHIISRTIYAFSLRPCSLGIEEADFESPTPLEVKALRNILGFSQVDLAKYTGVSWSHKGSTTVQQWESSTLPSEKSCIALSAWQLMLIKAGLVSVETIIT
jgi:DNA-binding transcriptional regulator YiaG